MHLMLFDHNQPAERQLTPAWSRRPLALPVVFRRMAISNVAGSAKRGRLHPRRWAMDSLHSRKDGGREAHTAANFSRLPSVDAVLKTPIASVALERFGHHALVNAIRAALAAARTRPEGEVDAENLAAIALANLEAEEAPRLKPVYNLTGTILHTNLGRALIADCAIEAAIAAMKNPVALEFDLASARRGERDDVVRGLLRELTGAEDATVVNNNAAAVLVVLNTLARGRGALVSRGELIEIGGAFRMPEIMSRAGAKLVEVGTTNRTHLKDYASAINEKAGLILKVHTSNYRIEGFTSEVSAHDLVMLSREYNVPLVNDLGSGTIVDLAHFGLVHEPTVSEAVADGADIVTFSGDKLLGGPQAGFIVGRKDLIARINRNPMKRALRVDKIRLAAIEATLKLYRDPSHLAGRLPTIRLLTKPVNDIVALAQRLVPALSMKLGNAFSVEATACASQVGSGALPLQTVQSAGLAIRPIAKRMAGRALSALTAALCRLPMPVIGRIEDQALILDLRCLDDEAGFVTNLATLEVMASPA
jgi:L-seryl-tRNA(Ser) seleniumtransferase